MRTLLVTRSGITLVETVVSTLLVGFVLVATLQIVGPIANSSSVHADRIVAANLANELTEEISTKRFIDPDALSIDDLGIDKGDTTTNRTGFDDVDDYNAWSSSPPTLSIGVVNYNLSSWTRSVTVVHAPVNDPNADSKVWTGLKRVTVTVSKNKTTLASVVSFHSSVADSIGFIVSPNNDGVISYSEAATGAVK